MNEIKLPFGIRDDVLVSIDEVEQGNACGCICPSCKSPLIAKKGSINQHHFAHLNDINCSGALETALHIKAKEILANSNHFILPEVRLANSDILIYPVREINYEKVELEYRINDIIPDVVIYCNGKPLLVEIAVTHRVTPWKAGRIFDLGLSAIEIYADQLFRKAFYRGLFNDFEKLLIEEVNYKRWINNVKANMIQQKINTLPAIRKNIHPEFYIVDACPLNKRSYKSGIKEGKSYAAIHEHCYSCAFGEVIHKKRIFNNGDTVINGKALYVECRGEYYELVKQSME